MNAIKREKNRNYTTISNVFLRDKNLSIKAKGFLAVVMSLPEDWDFTINGICSVLKEGRTAIYNIITELKINGYCSMDLCQNEKGIITGNDYSFSETPKQEWIEKARKVRDENQCTEKPHTENPYADNQCTDNPPQRNKEEKEVKNERSKEEKEKENNIFSKILFSKECVDINNFSDSSLPLGREDSTETEEVPERKVAPKESTPDDRWRTDFDEYMRLVREGADGLKADMRFRAEKERMMPGIDYEGTIDNCVLSYWGTEAAWEYKRRSRAKRIDMKATLRQNFDKNRVYRHNEGQTRNRLSLSRDIDEWNQEQYDYQE